MFFIRPDGGIYSCMSNRLTFEFFGFFGILGTLGIATQDLFRTYVLPIAGTTILGFEKTTEQIAEHFAGGEQEHNAQCDGKQAEAFHNKLVRCLTKLN
jgi:hypothetical protein